MFHNDSFVVNNIPTYLWIDPILLLITKNLSISWWTLLSAIKTTYRLKRLRNFHLFIKFMDLILSFIDIYKVLSISIWEALWINCLHVMIIWRIIWISIVNKVTCNSYFAIIRFVLKFGSNFQISGRSVWHLHRTFILWSLLIWCELLKPKIFINRTVNCGNVW